MASLLPNGMQQFFDDIGVPLAGGKVWFFVPATNSLKNTYQDINQTILNTNPVILDSAGRAVIYGTGSYRQILQDSVGNTIWDHETESGGETTNTGGGNITVSTAMQPVVEAATLFAGRSALGINPVIDGVITATSLGGAFNTIAADGGIIGNTVTLLSDLNVLGTINATSAHTAQLNSLTIHPGAQSLAVTPTGNAIGTFTSLNVQGITTSANNREFLVNFGLDSLIGLNGNATPDKVTLYVGITGNAGTSDIWAINPLLSQNPGSGVYNAQGIELDFNNLNAHRGDGFGVTGIGPPVSWGMSISGAGIFRSTGALLINSPGSGLWNRGICFAGRFTQACYQDVSVSANSIQIMGSYTNQGIDMSAGVYAGAAILLPNTTPGGGNNGTISWQNSNKSNNISDYVSNANDRVVGLGTTGNVYLCSHGVPNAAFAYDLGNETNRWRDCYLVDSPNVLSDVSLKTDIKPVSRALSIVSSIDPISFRWKDNGSNNEGVRTHFGFDAANIKQVFDNAGINFAGYIKSADDTPASLRVNELIAVLWSAVQEMAEEVKSLKSG